MTQDRSLDEFINSEATDDDTDANIKIDSDHSASSSANDASDKTRKPDDATHDDHNTTVSKGTGGTGTDESKTEIESKTDVSPAVMIFQCDPGGVSCPHCENVVTQRWRTQQHTEANTVEKTVYICADCKEW
ncbi:hypothetical protein [Haloquadratum walsbyi]|uniref:DUF7573 domain-containing protein n=1 Tax=Haloquadratum walsbyi J07HQW2 TaxID=1238425 RepID=U1NF89_9EURY|nr:hypothetical protein [Haloquadratum walsbyi]ERG95448.1 MAG: hypothetical protein J07HQW2_01905 [Haloquadratum walsbyi J07HQW2]